MKLDTSNNLSLREATRRSNPEMDLNSNNSGSSRALRSLAMTVFRGLKLDSLLAKPAFAKTKQFFAKVPPFRSLIDHNDARKCKIFAATMLSYS